MPATGFTRPTTVEALSPSCGVTLTLRFCVSSDRSTWPVISTSAAGPRMRNSFTAMTPRAMSMELAMRSNWKPLENTSRKSSAMRRGSICRLISDSSFPMPGSISRNCPSSACICSLPPSVA